MCFAYPPCGCLISAGLTQTAAPPHPRHTPQPHNPTSRTPHTLHPLLFFILFLWASSEIYSVPALELPFLNSSVLKFFC